MPVVELIPVGSASPNACVSRSTSASVAPGPTQALSRAAIDPHRFHRRQVDHQAAVADRAAGDVVSAAAHRDDEFVLAREVRQHACTSAAPWQRTTSPGRRSIMAFQIVRASSYSRSPLTKACPRRAALSVSTASGVDGVRGADSCDHARIGHGRCSSPCCVMPRLSEIGEVYALMNNRSDVAHALCPAIRAGGKRSASRLEWKSHRPRPKRTPSTPWQMKRSNCGNKTHTGHFDP